MHLPKAVRPWRWHRSPKPPPPSAGKSNCDSFLRDSSLVPLMCGDRESPDSPEPEKTKKRDSGDSRSRPAVRRPALKGLRRPRSIRRIMKLTALAFLTAVVLGPAIAAADWIPMFNGKDLAGWKSNVTTEEHDLLQGTLHQAAAIAAAGVTGTPPRVQPR